MRFPKYTGKQRCRNEITNLETGEISYGKEVVRDMQYSSRTGYVYRQRDNFIKVFADGKLPEGLSWSDKGKLSELRTYIVGSSQLLGDRKNGMFVPLTMKDISVIFNCKERCAYNTIEAAKKHGLIKKVMINDVFWFAFNPLYGLKDKRISLETYIIFQSELKDVIPGWVRESFIRDSMDMQNKPVVIK